MCFRSVPAKGPLLPYKLSFIPSSFILRHALRLAFLSLPICGRIIPRLVPRCSSGAMGSLPWVNHPVLNLLTMRHPSSSMRSLFFWFFNSVLRLTISSCIFAAHRRARLYNSLSAPLCWNCVTLRSTKGVVHLFTRREASALSKTMEARPKWFLPQFPRV